ncbi:charged multivesicular body protein 3-like [Panonychus citri]|uniref:charged multivesicular body protein 3-like n=1 Tax=Panonychus citri TaxID=50023 RepID=UPI00230770F8|nr:charged multivesicular body protein 3-like [Panonychus citri]XP_053210840.1 charged multivesicular body protein 3-like [Panonychus citri]
MGLFGKSGSHPKDKVQDWIRKLRKEVMSIDRQIRNIEREEAKTRLVIKETAKLGDEDSCRILAKELINSKKTIDRLITSKARINSVIMVMNTQLANLKISGNLAKSSEVMKSMQGLISVPELAINMKQLSKEMIKAGIMEEMISETIDQLNESDGELSEEESKLLEKLLFDTTQGKMGNKIESVDSIITIKVKNQRK